MRYFTTKPKWIRKFYGDCIWDIETADKKIYLTFDDGPDPKVTPYVLEQLNKYNAKATFFCIGSEVEKYSEIYNNILSQGHLTGNHTYSHIDGWKTANHLYFEDIIKASGLIHSNYYRPPFGHVTYRQVERLKSEPFNLKTVLWTVLSGDFDKATTPQDCTSNVLASADKGSIIVFHDTINAYKNLKYALPIVLETYSKKGFSFEALPSI